MELIVMCGCSGCGKSTFANALNNKYAIISTDAIRKELYGDESIQGQGKMIFDIAYQRIEITLKTNQSVIFDAMNLRSKDRKRLIQYFKNLFGEELIIICVFINASLNKCIENQKYRERKVPIEVMERQHLRLQPPTYQEGWTKIYIFE